MTEIFDFEEYKKRIADTQTEDDFPPELEKKLLDLGKEYSDKFNILDHSFKVSTDPETGKFIKDAIDRMRKDYQLLVFEVVEKLMRAESDLYFYKIFGR